MPRRNTATKKAYDKVFKGITKTQNKLAGMLPDSMKTKSKKRKKS